jgi:hypothetical protein
MPIRRRTFLRGGALAAMAVAPGSAGAAEAAVSLIMDPADPVASSGPVQSAAGDLQAALGARGVATSRHASIADAPVAEQRIVLAGSSAVFVQPMLRATGIAPPSAPESIAVVPADGLLLVLASDPRGLVYAVTDLADRVRLGEDPAEALRFYAPALEQPASRVRSIARCFESVAEDPAWFHDRDQWRAYLSMLAANRFNRFSLTLGLQYNYPMEVSDVYLYFSYPFLVSPPGYEVHARGLTDAERDRNLATVRFIGDEAVRRGLDFQLGLWTHGYKFDSPRVNYLVEGITPDNHAPYCRDALAALLKAVPAISGITFRIHGESGIPEGSYDFWQTVFQAFATAGRPVEIDMHAKGMDQKTIDIALATGMPVKVSPKYVAEHNALPYHVSAIRDVDMPPAGGAADAHFALSGGSRRFTRYSYADFLAENRRHGVLFRVWPGTQRVLLWGDPVLAAGYGRQASFCGADGAEWCEPLSFKGRMGSGRAGDRTGFADASLRPRWDWEKFAYQYRVLGRLAYNPATGPEVWQRWLGHAFGPAAGDAEAALSAASRVLPLVTLAHGPSVSNNSYWPEIYTNMSIVQGDDLTRPYYDTPKPPRFGYVETFDKRFFSRINEYVDSLLSKRPDARYSPVDVAVWLDALAGTAEQHGQRLVPYLRGNADLRRLAADVSIQAALGRFFAHKFRAAVLWGLHVRTNDPVAATEAVKAYRSARAAWAVAAEAGSVYVRDLSYGPQPWLRGHWRDRLPAIDADIVAMEQMAGDVNGAVRGDPEMIWAALGQVLAGPRRDAVAVVHEPPVRFAPGQALAMTMTAAEDLNEVRLHYRHVNQAENWQSVAMTVQGGGWRGEVPATYTASPFALQYYFELRSEQVAVLSPGLRGDLSNQPYYLVRQG